MQAVIASHAGGPEVLTLTEVERPACPPDRVRVDVSVSGVNFFDTYQRAGVYRIEFPRILGMEGAGVVAEVGDDVTWAAVGDRVAWPQTPFSYAQEVILAERDFYRVPEAVPLDTAGALMLQGLTAHYLATSSHAIHQGDVALIHAGAGGVGLLLTQLAVARGAKVITTVSSEEKEALSRAAGAHHMIRYDTFTDLSSELPATVRDLTDGAGVGVVYDGVGASTFEGSLASLAVRGTLVLFGGASGQVPPFDLQRLNTGGSLSISRPSLGHFLRTPEERAWRAGELFDAVTAGTLDVRVGARYALADAADAHRALEGRKTTGKVLLTA